MAYGQKGSKRSGKKPGLTLKSDMKMEGASKKGVKGSARKRLHKAEERK